MPVRTIGAVVRGIAVVASYQSIFGINNIDKVRLLFSVGFSFNPFN